MKPTVDLVDLSAEEAVQVAWRAHAAGDADALPRLDRSLRRRVLGYVLRGDEELSSLQTALVAAIDQALDMPELPWGPRWESLLDVLEDGRQMPSLERGTERLRALLPDGLGARVLQRLQTGPLRPSDLAELTLPATETSSARSQISRVLGQLEEAGLIERHSLGRATWVSLLPLGMEALKLQPQPQPERRAAANDIFLWNPAAFGEKGAL